MKNKVTCWKCQLSHIWKEKNLKYKTVGDVTGIMSKCPHCGAWVDVEVDYFTEKNIVDNSGFLTKLNHWANN